MFRVVLKGVLLSTSNSYTNTHKVAAVGGKQKIQKNLTFSKSPLPPFSQRRLSIFYISTSNFFLIASNE